MSSSTRNSNNGHSFVEDLKSYKLISSSFSIEWEYEGEDVFCFCNLKAPRRYSWTEYNPGRRFYGCARYPKFNCGFHLWHDPKVDHNVNAIINELKLREKFLYREAKMAMLELEIVRANAVGKVEAELIEENMKLKNKMLIMKKAFKNEPRHHYSVKMILFYAFCVYLLMHWIVQ